ncbi:acyl carrier protein [Streptomyces sp. NPDC051172]|uniref:acyl carrier protein n=1 Tax=Streptomyces sp. NPDC051172 TaxID=3155796 RepID=UPI00342D8740
MSLPSDAILQTVRDNLARELEIAADEVLETSRLDDLPRADSVRLLRVVSRLEREYGLEFDDDQIRDAETVADLVALVLAAQQAVVR